MLVRSLFDSSLQNTHEELEQLLIHASLQITAKSPMIWNGFHNFISNNVPFPVPCLAVFLPAIGQGSPLSPHSIYSPAPWLKGKTGVNVLLQPAGPGLRSFSALNPPLFTSLIAFTCFPLAFHLQPTSMSVVCFLFSQGES